MLRNAGEVGTFWANLVQAKGRARAPKRAINKGVL